MARHSAADVLRRYGAGERDFRATNLSGLCFRGQNLSGADFSGADLRSTDFRDAQLERTVFSGARGGQQRRWSLVLLILDLLTGGVAAAFLGMSNSIMTAVLVNPNGSFYTASGLVPAIAVGTVIFVCFLFLAWDGPTIRGIFALTIAVAAAVVYALAVSINWSSGLSLALALAFGGAGALASALAVALAANIAGASNIAGAVGVAFAVAFASAVASAGADPFLGTVATSALVFLSLAFWRSHQGAPGYVTTRSYGVALGAICGTCFSGADMRGAILSGALLRGTNFVSSSGRPTRVDQVCWKGARGLEWARLGGTILAEPRIRRLLIEGDGKGQDFNGLNLRGAYLVGVDLCDASFRNANLCSAILANAHLEGTNLAGAQCLGTDFSKAHLPGACLEAWNIDNNTNLHQVECAYVYLLESHDAQGHRRDDHHRERLPHDPDKTFQPGDFETYFKHVLEEVKLLIRNGVDPKAFQHAFQAVMRQHPQITPQSITGIKLMGNDVMATMQVPAGSDKAAIEHTFDAEYLLMMLENARLKGLLEGQRQRADDHRDQTQQVLKAVARLAPAAGPPSIAIENRPLIHVDNDKSSNATHTTSAVTHNEIKPGDGSFINTGTFQPSGGIVNLGALSDRARITIEAAPDNRQAADQPSLRELLSQLKASIDADTSMSDTTRADALAEVNDLAQAAQDPAQNAGLARRSINALKGLNEGIDESVKLATALKPLLTLISGFF